MSEAVSALAGARYEGFARIEEAGLRGMVTLRGDLGSAKFRKAVAAVAGVKVPGQRGAVIEGERGLCWMSPDELLLLCPYQAVGEVVAGVEKALKGTHFLAADVSDARAVFRVSGVDAREVLAKLTPADVSPRGLQPGECRRTRLAQVPAAVWMLDEATFEVICFRSVARYVFDLLKSAAMPGSEVGYF